LKLLQTQKIKQTEIQQKSQIKLFLLIQKEKKDTWITSYDGVL